jgi:hypothetical protein
VKPFVIGLVVAVVAAAGLYYRQADVVRAPQGGAGGEAANDVMQIILESGGTFSVNYLVEDGIVWAATDAPWWKDLRGDGDGVTVVLDGETVYGRARAVEDDEALRSRLLSRLRPNAPSSLGVLIEVKLAPSAARRLLGRS